MLVTFLITLREGLEAALIIGIVLAFLNKSQNRQLFKQVWLGTTLAIIFSLAAGVLIYFIAGNLEGRTEAIFGGSATILAALILTWMIVWMQRQAANIKSEIQNNVQRAIVGGSTLGLISLAFIAVVREGVETVLFLFASMRVSEFVAKAAGGAVLGLLAAIVGGYLIYKGSSRLKLKTFFGITSYALMLVAAGLLAYGIHELQEATLIPIIIEHVWDINNFIPEQSTFGRFLTTLFGYNGNPSLIEVLAYWVYLAASFVMYFIIAQRANSRNV